MYYVYIIECCDSTLYTGVAQNIEKRLDEHKSKKGAKYTKSHGFEKLLALWICEGRSDAQKLEYKIKQLSRKQKLMLISDNIHFDTYIKNLSPSLYVREKKQFE